MASTCIKRTPSSDGNSKKFTWSGWVKRSTIGAGQHLFSTWYQNNSRYSYFQFNADDTLEVYSGEYSTSPSSTSIYLNTKAKFSDTFGWYHIVLRVDTDDSTQADRVRVYVNGVNQEFNSSHSNGQTLPSSGTVTFFNKQYLHTLGRYANTGGFFDGLMSHVHWCDGYSYAPTEFGEEDSSTGEWKIKTSPSVSYGTNGYFLLKDGNSTTDQSGNSLSFTTEGTLTNTEDNPSNVFATFNPLHNTSATMSNGNLTAQSTNANYISGVSTLGTKTGKFYAEFKLIAEGASGEAIVGATAIVRPTSAIDGQTGNFGIRNTNGIMIYTSGGTAYNSTSQHGNFTINDVIGVGLDMDNGRLYFSKNGGWWNGASTWTGTSPSTYVTLQTDIYDEFFFLCGDAAGSQNANWSANFGNGYFGTTAISSEGTNASGIGKFEYDVPSGYTALSTKGLNE